MDILTLIAISVLFLMVFAMVYQQKIRPKNLPPGPFGLPLIGFSVRDDDCLHLTELSKIYGPIFSYFSGNRPIVVFNSVEIMREALGTHGECFVDRFQVLPDTKDNGVGNELGLLGPNGDRWKEQRQFALHTLRDLGFGRPVMENSIVDEIQEIFGIFDSFSGLPFDPKFSLNFAIANVISRLAFGKRFENDDEKVSQFLNAIHKMTKIKQKFIVEFVWWKIFLIPLQVFKTCLIAKKFRRNARSFAIPMVKEHRLRLKNDADQEPSDYIDAFLKSQQQNSGKFFTDEQLFMSVAHLFVAGTETTSTTVRWAILLLAANPEVQKKCYEEIRSKIGKDRLPQLSDRTKLPYLEAVIHETQRYGCLVSLMRRRCAETCQVAGYTIPKGTPILVNIFAAHMNPKTFPNPKKFDPDRFLSDDGDKNRKENLLVSFGVGKRICLGESLARMELFLFISALIQRYEFLIPEGQKPRLDHIVGITSQPHPYQIIARIRN